MTVAPLAHAIQHTTRQGNKRDRLLVLFLLGSSILAKVCAGAELPSSPPQLFPSPVCAPVAVNVSATLDTTASLLSATSEVYLRCPSDGALAMIFLNKNSSVMEITDEQGRAVAIPSTQGVIVLKGITSGEHRYRMRYEAHYAPADSAQPTGPIISDHLVSLGDEALWHPSFPGEAFAVSLTIELPKSLDVVAPGTLEEIKQTGARATYRFRADHVRSCASLVAAPFAVSKGSVGKLKVAVYSVPGACPEVAPLLAHATEILAFLVRRYGPFPYESLNVVQDAAMPSRNGRGMNSLVRLATDVPACSADTTYWTTHGRFLLAHEISHMYWATLLNAKISPSDFASLVALTEGMAHVSALAYTQDTDERAFESALVGIGKDYGQEWQKERDFSLQEIAATVPRRAATSKAALFLWGLAGLVGHDRFFQAAQEFLQQDAWGSRTLDDLVSAVKRHTDRPAEVDAYTKAWATETQFIPR